MEGSSFPRSRLAQRLKECGLDSAVAFFLLFVLFLRRSTLVKPFV